MEKQEILNNIKKEFSEEIKAINVSVEDLKQIKVSDVDLATEVALRKVFGDEIYERKVTEEKLDGEKVVIKLSDEDLAFDNEVRELCENLVDSDFESGLSVILSKVVVEEE